MGLPTVRPRCIQIFPLFFRSLNCHLDNDFNDWGWVENSRNSLYTSSLSLYLRSVLIYHLARRQCWDIISRYAECDEDICWLSVIWLIIRNLAVIFVLRFWNQDLTSFNKELIFRFCERPSFETLIDTTGHLFDLRDSAVRWFRGQEIHQTGDSGNRTFSG